MTELNSPSQPQEAMPESTTSSRKKWSVIGLAVVIFIGFLFFKPWSIQRTPFNQQQNVRAPENFELKTFSSEQEFQTYFQESQSAESGGFGMSGGMERSAALDSVAQSAPAAMPTKDGGFAVTNTAPTSPERVSGTNVQVIGIDEPDIVKTDGRQLFVSSEQGYYGIPRPFPASRPMTDPGIMEDIALPTLPTTSAIAPERMIMPVPGNPVFPTPVYQAPKTRVLSAFPPVDLAKIADIDETGKMLLYKNVLLVLGNANGRNTVVGIDVSQPSTPKKLWEVRITENNQLVTARLKGDDLYLVTQTYDVGRCDFTPLTQIDGQELKIACTDIYHPSRPVSSVGSVFTALKLDPATGTVRTKASIVGSGSSIVYMSPDSLYLTYQAQADMVKMMDSFVSEQGKDLFPQTVIDKLARLQSYELSENAKMIELQTILENHQRTLNKDDRLKLESELQNRMKDYLQKHSRELEHTMIVRFNTSDLKAAATGSVPGYALNQFALDEHEGNLRIATTFGQAWTQFGQPQSASDVYVLDSALRQKGVVQDLGQGERIYSVRFMADKGYVVTFKQVDPFYVLDLSNPSQPRKTGELKIPGYSSYLHALTDDIVVGIGKENNSVKISLFDVSNPADPREVSKYLLDEFWSEVESSHHAFLQDAKHKVFFMPGSKGGYVFSYANNQLTLASAISQTQTKRAVTIDDYMFVVGENDVTVLDEKTWKVVKELGI